VPVKGLGGPIETFELVMVGAARTRLEAVAPRGLTRFVGRSAELERIRECLDRASLGCGQVVALGGEPGVGKSRLIWEVTDSHHVHGWRPAARLMLLVNYRPEYSHAWDSKTYYRLLRIDPLPPESADEMLDALLGTNAALAPLKRRLVERTEANPLFLEESVRALADTGDLVGERGAYRLTLPVDQLKLSATVKAILAARIDRLTPEAKRLLQTAAVIGKDVSLPLLLAIADASEYEVRAELHRFQAAEFIYETRLFPDLEYTFKHALTHEVAYQGLLRDRTRALHARVTEAIEHLLSERIAEQVERLAHHALRGELWDEAVAYLRQAGLRAIARGANREAALEQALGALRRLLPPGVGARRAPRHASAGR